MKKAFVLLVFTVLGFGFAQTCDDGFRLFTHLEGETCVPDTPQRIVTLQDQNALLPLLELGVVPVGSAGLVTEDGYEYRATQGYDTSAVTFVGSYWPGPDVETVATLEPDLIVANPYIEDALDTYSKIAPTVIMDVIEQPMDDALFQFAELVGKTERAEELQAAFQAEAAELRAQLGNKLETTTISIVEYWDGIIYGVPSKQSLSLALPELGLVRTEYEQTIEDWVELSPELLGDNPADIAVLIAIPASQVGSEDTAFAEFLANPVVQVTDVGKAGQIFAVHPDAVYGVSWGRATDAMREFAAILMQDDLNRDLVQE
ncbi:MAG: ABC transporter substrate-binding protein [Deinococcota bacterium]